MGILRKLNRKKLERDKWKIISSPLCKGLERLQKSWFDYSIRMIKKSSIPLLNTQFGGNAELAIKAYQLYFVSCIIAAKNYVPRKKHENL